MGEFSFELCGGTHVARTGDIGLLLITQETGIAAGIRRIEAVTGYGAIEHIRRQFGSLDEVAGMLRAGRSDVVSKTRQLVDRSKQLEKEKEQLQGQLASGGGQDLASQAQDINGVKVIAARLDGADSKAIRNTIDRLRDKLGDSVVVLAGTTDDKAKLVVGVSSNVTARVHAGKLINDLVGLAGGRGGGRADMAEGGIPADSVEACLGEVVNKVRAYTA